LAAVLEVLWDLFCPAHCGIYPEDMLSLGHMYVEPIVFMRVCGACRSTQGQADGEKQHLTPTSNCHEKIFAAI